MPNVDTDNSDTHTPQWQLQWQSLCQNYEVNDIITEHTRCLFILESPHVQELKYKAPVSGMSGATMTRHIFGQDYAKFPLGILVRQNALHQLDRPRLSRIGLMNVCNIPMQGAAYGNPVLTANHQPLIGALEQIRANNQTDVYRDSTQNAVQAFLVENLRAKLLALPHRELTLVPCGRFAQKFVRLADVTKSGWPVLTDVPHPSYNSWDRPQYQAAIARVKQLIDLA